MYVVCLSGVHVITVLICMLKVHVLTVASKLKILWKKKEAYRDGIKRKGDKIGMGYMKHS